MVILDIFKKNSKTKLVLLVTLLSVLTIIIIISKIKTTIETNLRKSVLESMEHKKENYLKDIKFHERNLIIKLRLINRYTDLKKLLYKKNIRDLYKSIKPIFDDLKNSTNISHLYFHSINKVNILRVHHYAKMGDIINRETLDRAVLTNKNSCGVEIGVLGTLTLRCVMPYRYKNKLIGFIELGK